MNYSKCFILAGKECEERCLFCPYTSDYNEILEPPLSGSKIKETSNEVKDLAADKNRKLLTISGKNPFSSDNTLKLIDDNFNKFEKIIISAPGYSFLDLDLLEKLEKYKEKLVLKITVLSHRRDVHDLITSTKDSWSKSCKGILLLKKKGFDVRISTVITKINYFYLKEMPFFVKTLGLNEWEISYPKPLGKALDNIEMLMPSIDMALPLIEECLYQASKNDITAFIKNIPVCLVKKATAKELNADFNDENSIFEKSPNCKECLKNAECKGFFKEYFKMFDIKPNELLDPIK